MQNQNQAQHCSHLKKTTSKKQQQIKPHTHTQQQQQQPKAMKE
jgi:hypothetical protein